MTKNLFTRLNKKIALLRAKNDVTHALQLKLHERMNKSIFVVVVTSYGLTKIALRQNRRRPIIASAIAVRLLKKTKAQCQNAACEQKPLARKINSVQTNN